MRKILMLLFAMIFCSNAVSAQSTEDSVKATIQQLFKAMKSSDVTLLKECFSDSAILQTIEQTKEGKTVIKNVFVENFVQQIAKIEQGSADERITFETIKIDGPLAIVWTPYQFYWKGQFSHCGVNSFQLVRINQHWEIQYLIDTRRKVNCIQ
jgi:hypothetical protein